MIRYYHCPKHGDFDDFRRDDYIIRECPKCGAPVKQKYGLNFKLIGPGFYSTDNVEVK